MQQAWEPSLGAEGSESPAVWEGPGPHLQGPPHQTEAGESAPQAHRGHAEHSLARPLPWERAQSEAGDGTPAADWLCELGQVP